MLDLVKRIGVGGALLMLPAMATAQEPMPGTRGQALSSVVQYRIGWVDERTPFDACSIREALEVAPGRPLPILEGVKSHLDRPEAAPCPGESPSRDRLVRIDSVVVHDTTATVYARVTRGENVHREEYRLRAIAGRPGWGVRDVRLWGALRLHPPPRYDTEEPRQGGAAGNLPAP